MREFRQLSQSDRASEGWKQDLNSSQLPFELKALNHSSFRLHSSFRYAYELLSYVFPFLPLLSLFLVSGFFVLNIPNMPSTAPGTLEKASKEDNA